MGSLSPTLYKKILPPQYRKRQEKSDRIGHEAMGDRQWKKTGLGIKGVRIKEREEREKK